MRTASSLHNTLIRGCDLDTPSFPAKSSAAHGLTDLLDYTRGMVVQMHGDAALTVLVRAIALLQQVEALPPVFISASRDCFFPPDVESMGVDLSALPVLRPQDELQTGTMIDTVLRSRLVSAVIADIPDEYRFDLSRLSRFMHVVRTGGSRLVLLQSEDAGLLSSSVGIKLRVESVDERGLSLVVYPERSRTAFPVIRIYADARMH